MAYKDADIVSFGNVIVNSPLDEELNSVLASLEGATLLKVGRIDQALEGGLAIDYRKGEEVRRLVLGYNDLGTWVAWHGVRGQDSPEDKLARKMAPFFNSEAFLFRDKGDVEVVQGQDALLFRVKDMELCLSTDEMILLRINDETSDPVTMAMLWWIDRTPADVTD